MEPATIIEYENHKPLIYDGTENDKSHDGSSCDGVLFQDWQALKQTIKDTLATADTLDDSRKVNFYGREFIYDGPLHKFIFVLLNGPTRLCDRYLGQGLYDRFLNMYRNSSCDGRMACIVEAMPFIFVCAPYGLVTILISVMLTMYQILVWSVVCLGLSFLKPLLGQKCYHLTRFLQDTGILDAPWRTLQFQRDDNSFHDYAIFGMFRYQRQLSNSEFENVHLFGKGTCQVKCTRRGRRDEYRLLIQGLPMAKRGETNLVTHVAYFQPNMDLRSKLQEGVQLFRLPFNLWTRFMSFGCPEQSEENMIHVTIPFDSPSKDSPEWNAWTSCFHLIRGSQFGSVTRTISPSETVAGHVQLRLNFSH